MKHGLRPCAPRFGQLKHRTLAACAALIGCAIEVSGLIEDQTGKRVRTIIAAAAEKAVDYVFGPCAIGIYQFEDFAEAVGTALVGRAIKITRPVGNQGAIGDVTVHATGLSAEVVEHTFGASPRTSH